LRSKKSETRINTTDLYSLETRYSSPRARKNLGAKFKKESAPPQRSWDNYNDEMAEKQCDAYTQWLNYMFQSPEHLYEVEQSQRQEAGIPDDIDRPTLRTLLVHRRRAQATLRAVQFYNGPIMLPMKRTIFNEIITDKISMRSDQDVLSNVMLRGQLLDLLMSYSTPWLRLGLEIIFGEVISNASGGNSLSPVKSNSTDSTHSKNKRSIASIY
jgi:abnormal spindle-like microcephaly-associated protein